MFFFSENCDFIFENTRSQKWLIIIKMRTKLDGNTAHL